MKLHGDLIFEKRFGSIALRWDLHSWGIGIDVGAFRDDWLLAKENDYYWTMWIKARLGPVDFEIAHYGKGRKWEKIDRWIPLRDLREGAIFETKDDIVAMKTEYHTFASGTQCDCYLLNGGETAHFPNKDNELVRELSDEEWTI